MYRANRYALTFVLVLSAANGRYEVVRRFIRHPWPLDGLDTLITAVVVREAGLGLAGPPARRGQLFGTLVAFAAIGSVVLPRVRRALHAIHVAEQRVAGSG